MTEGEILSDESLAERRRQERKDENARLDRIDRANRRGKELKEQKDGSAGATTGGRKLSTRNHSGAA